MYIVENTWRHVYDNIHLRGEILIGCIIVCITVAIQVIIFAIDILGGYNPSNEKYTQIFHFCCFVSASIACFGLIIVSTTYVRIQINKHETQQNQAILWRGDTDIVRNSIIDESYGLWLKKLIFKH